MEDEGSFFPSYSSLTLLYRKHILHCIESYGKAHEELGIKYGIHIQTQINLLAKWYSKFVNFSVLIVWPAVTETREVFAHMTVVS